MNSTNDYNIYLNAFVKDYIINCLFGSYEIRRNKQKHEKMRDINIFTRVYYELNKELCSNFEIILNKPKFDVDEDFFLCEFRDEFYEDFEIYWSEINENFIYCDENSKIIKNICNKIDSLYDAICFNILNNKSLTFFKVEKIIKNHFS